MLEELKIKVLNANLNLIKNGLVFFTWGNVSAIDRKSGFVVIKPSGVKYGDMTAEDIVLVDLDGQRGLMGSLKSSSDTPTHLELYRAHKEIGGIVHTHSTYATAFAQAGKDIRTYGTTHADYFYGDIPCSRSLTESEMVEYEKNTGVVINETFENKDIAAIPACLVKNHGIFTWGRDANEAVYHATVAEEVAKMAYLTEMLGCSQRLPPYIADKHYNRKHGKNAYYGQNTKY